MEKIEILNVTELAHPDYLSLRDEWEKYRYIMEGGDEFVDEYLVKFSARETDTEFNARKEITPSGAFARGAILDVKNSIFQRMSDISRNGGSKDYQAVIKGLNGGVDQSGSSINHFIGKKILPELLFLGKVGVYIDMPQIIDSPTLIETRSKTPYFYTYRAEDILNWEIDYFNNTAEFTQLLLKDSYYKFNDFNLPLETASRYRLITKGPNDITVKFFDPDNLKEPISEQTLNLPRIPFILLELDQPLTRDIANHQVALMNLESSDISYTLKANYPFYVEQRSKQGSYLKGEENSEEGTEIEAGGNIGRAYAPSLDRPGFIHPSSEPLEASMQKQKNLKDDIRLLINLSLSNVKSKYASAESKEMDEHGLESGLSALGLVLEQGERELATIFSLYEQSNEIATIAYPTKYSLKTDLQKLSEVEKLSEQRDKIPSKSCQKVISKKMASILIGTDVSAQTLQEILKEIDNANYLTGSPTDINLDLEHGLVSLETAAIARGYNKEEIEKAKADHAERIARIVVSQGTNARGVNDLDSETNSGKLEKKENQNPDLDETGKKKVRK